MQRITGTTLLVVASILAVVLSAVQDLAIIVHPHANAIDWIFVLILASVIIPIWSAQLLRGHPLRAAVISGLITALAGWCQLALMFVHLYGWGSEELVVRMMLGLPPSTLASTALAWAIAKGISGPGPRPSRWKA